jgi:MFS family permease
MPAPTVLARKNNKRLPILYALGLLLAFSTALPAYIQSNFLAQFVSLETVSLFFMLGNFLTIIAILFFPGLIKKLSNSFLIKIVLIAFFVSSLWLSMAADAVSALLAIILFSVAVNLIWINMDFLVESFSANATTGRTRTIYFTFMNAGWIVAPIFSSYLIVRGGYTLTFLVSAFFLVPWFLIFLTQEKRLRDRTKYSQEKILSVAAKIWRDKNLRGIFAVALLLQLFYSSAVVYIPIYLYQTLGLEWNAIGIIFSLMLIPFILFEIPAGLIADKYLGEKEILITGFTILTLSLFLFYYIKVPTVWLWALVFFVSRTGASLIEAMRETYFFKIVDVEDVNYINLFRLTGPLAYIIGPGLAILTLRFLPLNYLFLVIAVIILSGFYFVASLKDTK